MLNQADIETIAKVFGKTSEEISGALKSEDGVSLDLRLNGKVFTPEEIEAKTRANQDAYIEIGYKKIAKEAGLELDSSEKNPTSIVSKLKSGIETTLEKKYKNMTPTEELTAAIKKQAEFENKHNLAKQTIEKLTTDLGESNSKFENMLKDISVKERNNNILSSFPEKMNMDRKDALTIINSMLEYEDGENGLAVKRDGKLVMSPTGDNEELGNVISSIIEEKGWAKAGGAGGGDRGGAGNPKGMSDDDAIAYIEGKGIEAMSAEGSKMFSELTSK